MPSITTIAYMDIYYELKHVGQAAGTLRFKADVTDCNCVALKFNGTNNKQKKRQQLKEILIILYSLCKTLSQ